MLGNNGKSLVIVTLITLGAILYALRDSERFQVIEKDFKSPLFLGSLVVVIAFTALGLSSSNERLYEAVSKGVIAFITAYLSRVNMSFAAFFVIVVFAYFTFSWPSQNGTLLPSSRHIHT